MHQTDFSKTLQRFVDSNFQSVEQIDVLLLLFSHRDKEWTLDDVDKQVRSSQSSIDTRLKQLVQQQFLSIRVDNEVFYRYSPKTAELDTLVTQLAEQYRIRRNRVIESIYSSPTQKMLDLKDAFKVKGGDSNE